MNIDNKFSFGESVYITPDTYHNIYLGWAKGVELTVCGVMSIQTSGGSTITSYLLNVADGRPEIANPEDLQCRLAYECQLTTEKPQQVEVYAEEPKAVDSLKDKIEYLFTDKNGNIQTERKLTIMKGRSWCHDKGNNLLYDRALYLAILSSNKVNDDGGNIFHEQWSESLNSAINTLVNDKMNGFELPTDEEVNQWMKEKHKNNAD